MEVSRQLFEFAELPWNRQTERFIQASTSRQSNEFYSVFKDPKKSAYKWREELTEEEIHRVRSIAGDTVPGRLFEDIADG
jgi:hypothetical protein